jgi:hypothetical protein
MGLHGKGFSRITAVHAYKVFIRPILEYGLAMDKFPAHDRKRLDRFQMKSCNTIFSTPHTTSQRALLLLTNLILISNRNAILATKSWSSQFDRAEDNSHFSSYSISLLPSLKQYKLLIFSDRLWRSITKTVPLPTSFVKALNRPPDDSTKSRLETYINTAKEKLHNHKRVLCRTISPRNRPSIILTIKNTTRSRLTQRRLILY